MKTKGQPPVTSIASPSLPDEAVTRATDGAAVALSLLCIVHCLALPLAAMALPFLAAAAEAEWVHWVFAVLAVLVSAMVVANSPSARALGFLVPVGTGAALVVFGLFAEGVGMAEALPTVTGGLLLAFAHGRRLAAG
jgi:hypothetical protein